MDLWSTNIERMKKISIPIHQEQQKIASFLDKKTAEFDSIIEKKQSFITKLTEAKKSLISEVVTGKVKVQVIDNNYQVISRADDEMKDSGVEWLGKIPKEWEKLKINKVSNVVRGGSPRPAGDPKYFNEEFGIHWITVAEITKDNNKYLNNTKKFFNGGGEKTE